MRTTRILSIIAFALATVAAGHTYAADAEPMDLDADLLAKIAKEKIKSKVGVKSTSVGTADQLNQSNTCGAVDIGNVAGPKPGLLPKDNTVIVTGDVINTAKCK